MRDDCNYYFLSETALQIWRKKDAPGQQKMYDCFTAVYKQSFFKQVVFKNGKIPEHRLFEIANEAFITTWEDFNIKGMAGNYVIEKTEYPALLYTIFKRGYIRDFQKEIKKATGEKEFYQNHSAATGMPVDKNDAYSPRTQRALNKISADCKQLLIWKYVEGASYDEIAQKKNIERIYCIKMVWRCKQQFSRHLV